MRPPYGSCRRSRALLALNISRASRVLFCCHIGDQTAPRGCSRATSLPGAEAILLGLVPCTARTSGVRVPLGHPCTQACPGGLIAARLGIVSLQVL